MELVALLPERALARVRAAVPSTWIVTAVRALDGRGGLITLLERGDVDLVILDPADPRLARRTCTLVELFRQHGTLRGVLYTALTTGGMKASAPLLSSGRCDFLLTGVDDQPSAIRALLQRVAGDVVSDLVLEAIGRELASLPEHVRRAVRTLFAAPHRFHGVDDLAATAIITRRHLVRVVTLAGLRGARELLIVAGVIRAYRLLQGDRVSLATAARRLNMDPRILSRHIRLVVRCAPATAVAALPVAELVRSCEAALVAPAVTAGATQ